MGQSDIRGSDAIAWEAEGPGTGDAHWPVQQPAGGAEQRLGFVSTEAGSFSVEWAVGKECGASHLLSHSESLASAPSVKLSCFFCKFKSIQSHSWNIFLVAYKVLEFISAFRKQIGWYFDYARWPFKRTLASLKVFFPLVSQAVAQISCYLVDKVFIYRCDLRMTLRFLMFQS